MAVAALGRLNLVDSPPWGSRSVDCFDKLEKIGEGNYGEVFMAKERRTGEIVALKKIRMDNEREGFPITAIREIKILKKLHHENVVQLKEIVTSPGPEKDEQGKIDGNKYKGSIYMVFEYMDHDLTGLTNRGLRFTVPQIKCYMRQLLTGLHYCHANQILHRDIKGSNLLIDNEGTLKLADFGLARSFYKDLKGSLTNRVITLWYRPPELLLGATKYGPAVDMWSAGCIFAELLHGKPILPGNNELDQLNKISELCGVPGENHVREVFKHFDGQALKLVEKMLDLDPSKRISAKNALLDDYFWSEPLPCNPKSFPRYESSHEFQTKKQRQQQRQNEEIAKRQKLQHPQQHAYLHIGQAHHPHWTGPNNPIVNSQPPVSGELGQCDYDKPCALPQGSSRYPPSRNPTWGNNSNCGGKARGYSSGSCPPRGRDPPYTGSIMPAAGPKGTISGNGVAQTNYPQGN